MKHITLFIIASCVIILLCAAETFAQNASAEQDSKDRHPAELKTFVIKRDIPEAGKLTADQLKSISQTSCTVIKEMGPRIEWIQSYVTETHVYCIYRAENEATITEHAKKGGFPANEIIEVSNMISPATAELPINSSVKKKL